MNELRFGRTCRSPKIAHNNSRLATN